MLYDLLSDDIHLARGCEEVFEKALKDVNSHFELRDIYKRLKPATNASTA
jgi:hypothetical protein